jgi:hypothetical protein
MQIFKRAGERDRPDAQESFVLGERSLRAYLAGGNVRFLEDAVANFSLLGEKDRRYDDACFYLGVTKTQLRKVDESIPILEDLLRRKRDEHRRSNADFEHKIGLQLAYAHIKRYTDEGYDAAEKELARLKKIALNMNDLDLLVRTQSIQVFLYSVMSGRAKPVEHRPAHARNALELGAELLKTPRSSLEVRFEALNALGITWMWVANGQWESAAQWGEFCDPKISRDDAQKCPHTSCVKAQSYYEQALDIVPNSVRVLQNLARLRLIQVKHNFPTDRSVLLAEAKQFVLQSLEVNDQDQYPYSELAEIAIEEGDAKLALDSIGTGRNRPGAVKEEKWAELEQKANALAAREAAEREART